MLKQTWGGGTQKNSKLHFWWPSFTSYHLFGHLGWQSLLKITKMVIITHRVNIETCNKNQTPRSLDQSSILAWCLPSWISAITRNHRNGNYNSLGQHRDLQQKPNLTQFGSIFNFNVMSAILDSSHYHKSQNGNYNSKSQHRDLHSSHYQK